MTEKESQSQDKFIVRLPDGMRDQIKAAADAAGRSMNAEIVVRLSYTLGLDLKDEFRRYEAERIEERATEGRKLVESLSDLKEDLIDEIARRVAASLSLTGSFLHQPEGRVLAKAERKPKE